MKIKRFFAPDIRQAMRMVREELGAEAVILSNKNVDGGTEIVAARDFDEELIQQNLNGSADDSQSADPLSAVRPKLANVNESVQENKNSRLKPSSPGTLVSPNNVSPRVVAPRVTKQGNAQLKDQQQRSKISPAAVKSEGLSQSARLPSIEPILSEMRKEFGQLRKMLDVRLLDLAWTESLGDNPIQLEVARRLQDLGYSSLLARTLVAELNERADTSSVWQTIAEQLVSRVSVSHDDLLETGGIVALIGPTGVGKTTTIAKLAAKFRLRHGEGQVGLVTTDNYRIAAHEQLNTYGKILDAPVRIAHDAINLKNILNEFSDKRLVLIDTAGMSQRDLRLAEQFSLFRSSSRSISSYLVMSAATELKALCEIKKAFDIFEPCAGILTKLDETVCIGSAISVVIEQKLPIAFVSDGQKVPENLHSPSERTLVQQSLGANLTQFHPMVSGVDRHLERRAHALV